MREKSFALFLFPNHSADFIACFQCLSECLEPNVTSDTDDLSLSVYNQVELERTQQDLGL